jgi:hypothetical protein
LTDKQEKFVRLIAPGCPELLDEERAGIERRAGIAE